MVLSSKMRKWAHAAMRAQSALKQGVEVSICELNAFLSLKGLPVQGIELARKRAERYLADEQAARLRFGETWNKLSAEKRIKLLHDVCTSEGIQTYTDPVSGFTVFSAFGHLRRGSCCGVHTRDDGVVERTHRCRHCPFGVKGTLLSKRWMALKHKSDLLEYVRVRALKDHKDQKL